MTAFIIILAIFLAMEFSGRAKKAGMAQEYRSKLQKEKAIQEAQKENLEMMRKEYFKEASKYKFTELYSREINSYLREIENQNKAHIEEIKDLRKNGHLYLDAEERDYHWLNSVFLLQTDVYLVATLTEAQGKKDLNDCSDYFKNMDWYFVPPKYSDNFLKEWKEKYPDSVKVIDLEEKLRIAIRIKNIMQNKFRYTTITYNKEIMLKLLSKYGLTIDRQYNQNLYMIAWEYTQKQFGKK